MVFGLLWGAAGAHCINKVHAQEQKVKKQGKMVKVKDYDCLVKRSESVSFSEQSLCKNCGCHISDHDDV